MKLVVFLIITILTAQSQNWQVLEDFESYPVGENIGDVSDWVNGNYCRLIIESENNNKFLKTAGCYDGSSAYKELSFDVQQNDKLLLKFYSHIQDGYGKNGASWIGFQDSNSSNFFSFGLQKHPASNTDHKIILKFRADDGSAKTIKSNEDRLIDKWMEIKAELDFCYIEDNKLGKISLFWREDGMQNWRSEPEFQNVPLHFPKNFNLSRLRAVMHGSADRLTSLDQIEYILEKQNCGNSPNPSCDLDSESSSIILNKSYNLVSEAVRYDSIIRLTKDEEFQKGAIWANNKIDLTNDFHLRAKLRLRDGFNAIADGSNSGADGIAIVFQNDGLEALGNSGGGIGYEGIENGLAIEFDLYNNFLNFKDPNGFHVGMAASRDKISAKHENMIFDDELPSDLLVDRTEYQIDIIYSFENKIFDIYFENSLLKSLTDFEFAYYFDLDFGASFVGITSATGSSYQRHEITDFKICPYDGIAESVHLDRNNGVITTENGFIKINSKKAKNIKIIDLIGNEIQSNKTNNPLDINNLNCGVYILTYQINSEYYHFKFIKE